MRIGIIGGTGDFGGGLSVRLAQAGHEVVVGSRDEDRASEAADEYSERTGVEVESGSNADAAKAEVVVLAVPFGSLPDVVDQVAEVADGDATVISPVTSMKRDDDGFKYDQPDEGSAAQLVRDGLPDSFGVAGAFHNIAAGRLADPDAELGVDIAVFGEADAKQTAVEVVESVEGVNALDAGSLGNAAQIESVTPLLINIGIKNGLKDLGIKFV
ncbi:MAG: NADPH-dependent F420 reductase [Halobacteria archaeon]|nr:NADPH-dependent F420 reductase [Halobacteria archaeon]